MATHIRCFDCRSFFDIKQRSCPDCGQLRHGFSEHLHKSALDGHLWKQAAEADKTKRQYAAIQKGYQIPPTRAQRAKAREIVANL